MSTGLPAWAWASWKEWKHVKPIVETVGRVAARLRKPKRGILIVGSGGVGKSTLKGLLQGDFDYHLYLHDEYRESFGVESGVLREDKRLPVTALPGQKDRRASSWPDVLEQVAAGRFAGIIVVAANGYHSMGDLSMKRHECYMEGDSTESFVDRLIINRRKDEVRVLAELDSCIARNFRPTWLLTFVGKQDLWCGQQDQVEDYYRSGEYGKKIARLSRKKAAQHWRTELLFGSLLIAPFVAGPHSDILKANEPGFGTTEQVESVRRLKKMVESLLEWNKSK